MLRLQRKIPKAPQQQSVEKHPPLLDNVIPPGRGSGGNGGQKWKERIGNEREGMEEETIGPWSREIADS